jgi:hypothetical protein
MELDELKMIWDSQNEEPLYVMNEAALHRVIQRRNAEWSRSLSCCFANEIWIGLVCAGLMFVCAGVLGFGDPAWLATHPWMKVAASRWDIVALVAAGGVWLYYTAYMFTARKRQQQRVELFDSSLRGDVDRALYQTDFQITLAKDIVSWGLVPVWIASTLWVGTLFHLEAAPAWAYVFMGAIVIGLLVIVVSGKRESITNRFQPRRRELESLRAKLGDPQR